MIESSPADWDSGSLILIRSNTEEYVGVVWAYVLGSRNFSGFLHGPLI